MAATIIDVAKKCGYSKATVSRAFASPETVSERAKKRIYAAASELNYTPNPIARAMARQKTDNISFVVHENQYPAILNPFYSLVLEAIMQEAMKRDYSLFVTSNDHMRLPTGDAYIKKHMDGVIIAGQTDEEYVTSFLSQNIPVVVLNNLIEMEGLPCITVDNYHGAKEAAAYEWKWSAEQDEIALKECLARGMVINDVSDEPAWTEAARSVWPQFYDKVGGKAVVDEALAIMQQ